jgi:prefoldin subunit 5
MNEDEETAIEDLKQQVGESSDVMAAATAALTGYVQRVADLAEQLQDAVTGDDEDVVKETSDALQRRLKALRAAIPEVAQAIARGE